MSSVAQAAIHWGMVCPFIRRRCQGRQRGNRHGRGGRWRADHGGRSNPRWPTGGAGRAGWRLARPAPAPDPARAPAPARRRGRRASGAGMKFLPDQSLAGRPVSAANGPHCPPSRTGRPSRRSRSSTRARNLASVSTICLDKSSPLTALEICSPSNPCAIFSS